MISFLCQKISHCIRSSHSREHGGSAARPSSQFGALCAARRDVCARGRKRLYFIRNSICEE